MARVIRIKRTSGGPCADATVENSDLSYSTTVVSGGTLVLSDITHVDPQGNNVILPAQTPFNSTTYKSGISYRRPPYTGAETSYNNGDDYWNLINAIYDYTAPVYPLSTAILDKSSPTPFMKLVDNNAFGNKYRFTDDTGVQTYSNDYVIDHLTGLGYYRLVRNDVETWSQMVDRANASTQNGFTDWRMVNRNEVASIQKLTPTTLTLNYAPFNITNNIMTSTTYGVTTSAFRLVNTGGSLEAVGKTTTSQYLLLVRNHF